jgi:hypothetical protein
MWSLHFHCDAICHLVSEPRGPPPETNQVVPPYLRFSTSKTVGFSLFFETGSHYVAHTVLELTIILPQLPKCWDYRCATSFPFFLPSLTSLPFSPPSLSLPSFIFWDKDSLCRTGWFGNWDLPALVSQVLGLQACATMPGPLYKYPISDIFYSNRKLK